MDRTGTTCTTCKKGKYEETSVQDDMDGVLHCSSCGKRVKRHAKENNPEKKQNAFDFDDLAQASMYLAKAGSSLSTSNTHIAQKIKAQLDILKTELDQVIKS